MGLHRRALQNANVISQDMEWFAHDANHDIHVEFRTTLKAKHFSSESPEEKKAYKDSADKLLVDTLQKTGYVITRRSSLASLGLHRRALQNANVISHDM